MRDRFLGGGRRARVPVGLLDAVRMRWQGTDPLLPDPVLPDGAELLTAVAGDYAACAALGRIRAKPSWYDALWGPLDRHILHPCVAGDVAAGLDALLVTWRTRLHARAEPGAESAAMVAWPSREIDGPRALYAHGLAPYSVLAVRPAGRGGRPADPAVVGVRIRRAGPEDVVAAVDQWAELNDQDVRVGSLLARPAARELMTEEMRRVLAAPDPWIWLAERDGRAVGMVAVVPPGDTGWIAPQVRGGPVAYLASMGVTVAERGNGVGAVLAAHAHAYLDRVGAALTLLHHAQVNPRSGPFWYRNGYRPLWTNWQVRPAEAIR